MNTYIVQYIDKNGEYREYRIRACDYITAIESCVRECLVLAFTQGILGVIYVKP